MKKKDVSVNSKQRILKIASELFSDSGFLGVSMADIAKSLNITKAALYYHFTNKKELYLEVLEKSFRNLIKSISKVNIKEMSLERKLSEMIQSYLRFGLREKNLIKSLIVISPKSDPKITRYITELGKRVNQQFQLFLKKILRKRVAAQEVDLKFITSGLLGTMDRLIFEAALFNKKLNIKKRLHKSCKLLN